MRSSRTVRLESSFDGWPGVLSVLGQDKEVDDSPSTARSVCESRSASRRHDLTRVLTARGQRSPVWAPGVLDVQVRFDEKNATVRYRPGQVTLDQILARYADTPFGVSPSGPVVTIARTPHGSLRGWTERKKSGEKESEAANGKSPSSIHLFLDFEGENASGQPRLSLADPPVSGLALRSDLQKAEEEPLEENALLCRALRDRYRQTGRDHHSRLV